MLNPVLFAVLEKYLAKTETLEEQTLEEAIEEEKQIPVDICNHALLVGYGRVGSLLGEKLMAAGIPLVVIEPHAPEWMNCVSAGSERCWEMLPTKKL
ncbi:putative cation:proton antiport protein [Citrobacter freundii]|nr:putative cation:proton antiport protein [Citrobacter freundii]